MCELSKLEFVRTGKGITRKSLSEMCANKDFDANHMLLSIIRIETGKIVCPKPRKTYEYKRLAKVLKCNVDDIYGIKEQSNEL